MTAYTIRATSCEGSPDGGLCQCCKQLSRSLDAINRHATKSVEIHGNMHVTAASVQLMGPNITAAAMSAIREKKDGQIQNLGRINARLRENMRLAKFGQYVEHDDDRETLLKALRDVLPIANKMFGEDSIQYHVFKESFQELLGNRKTGDGKSSTRNRYHPEVMVFALSLLRDADAKTYNSLRDVMYLP